MCKFISFFPVNFVDIFQLTKSFLSFMKRECYYSICLYTQYGHVSEVGKEIMTLHESYALQKRIASVLYS